MASSAPIEAKVKAATTGSFLVSLLLAALNAYTADSTLLHPLPAWAQAAIITLGPPVATFLASWSAPHTPRPGDTPAAR
ncbi:holin [Streptomyces sp. NPDC001404]|uniref:holin n=1 Tax=Streptomyces sp. NPDC001404 TaxID=3364571 RepID=UPI0036AD0B8A